MQKQFTTITITAVITAIIVGGVPYLWQKIRPTPITPVAEEINEETNGQAAHNEIENLLVQKFGMRLYRESIYDMQPVKSLYGPLVATVQEYQNMRFIKVANQQNNSLRQYVVNTDTGGFVEEFGDIHFSPDGKKLAYGAYIFNGARNPSVIVGGMSYVYIVDLETGKQSMLQLTKKADTVLRVTDWREEQPVIVEELLNEKNHPGDYPRVYIPYNLK